VSLSFPVIASSLESRSIYCYRIKERLRILHNEKGAEVRKGLLSKAAFDEWLRLEWEPRHKAVLFSLHQLPGFTLEVPPEYLSALEKEGRGETIKGAEQKAIDTVRNKTEVKTVAYGDKSWDAYIDLDKCPKWEPVGKTVDPLEDYTSYSTDGTGFSVAEHLITLSGLYDNGGNKMWKGKTTSGDFVHAVDAKIDSLSGNWYTLPYIVSDGIGKWYTGIIPNNCYMIGYSPVTYYSAYGVYTDLIEGWWYNNAQDIDTGGSTGVWYYSKIVRDCDVGTYGTVYGYTYSDAARTTLLSSQALALHWGPIDYTYVMPLCSSGASAQYATASFANLDLAWAPSSFSGVLKRYTGATWVKAKLKACANGSTFEAKPLKRWNGSAWVTVDTTGV